MDGSLDAEPAAAIVAIDGFRNAEPWAWERNARAGAYCSVAICVGQARTCDLLVLILGSDLSEITEQEYRQRRLSMRSGSSS